MSHIVSLHDKNSGSQAEILVSQGFNCFRFRAMPAGEPVEVIYAPEDFSLGEGRPSRGGIPLLFPFPGRIAGTARTWKGKTYQLEAGDAFGNAIHGFLLSRPWRVIDQSESHVVGEFHAWKDDPSLKDRWPADFRVTASYALDDNALVANFAFENPCDAVLPCGFGTHPYFRVPLGGGAANDCVVKLPVSGRWELKDMLPTGQRENLRNAAAFQAGQRFADLQLDDVFTGLKFADGFCTASIRDPESKCTITQRFTDEFRECVAYTPPHRQAICIEPYTCVPGSIDLANRGIVAGLRLLPPGGSFTAQVQIIVS